MGEPGQHRQRAGQGAPAYRLQPDRARGRRPGDGAVRCGCPHGCPGSRRYTGAHQLPGSGGQEPGGRHTAGGDRARRCPDHQRSLDVGRTLLRHHGADADFPGWRIDRLRRLHHPPYRHRRVRHRRGRPGHPRGGIVDTGSQALRARRTERGPAQDHRAQRAYSRGDLRRSRRTAVERQDGRRPVECHVRPLRASRHRGTGR